MLLTESSIAISLALMVVAVNGMASPYPHDEESLSGHLSGSSMSLSRRRRDITPWGGFTLRCENQTPGGSFNCGWSSDWCCPNSPVCIGDPDHTSYPVCCPPDGEWQGEFIHILCTSISEVTNWSPRDNALTAKTDGDCSIKVRHMYACADTS
ncbi:hypothetical protein V8F20_010943 [Naviculisporaceae sp. PSN 640]